MANALEEIKTIVEDILKNFNKELVSVKKIKEFGINKIQILIDDPKTFILDIDEVSSITEVILDAINDLIPDGYYLEVSSLGAERELTRDIDFERALNKYIYISTYQKIKEAQDQKELYGYLLDYDNEKVKVNVVMKTRLKEIIINKDNIAKIRLAVNFKESEQND